MKRFNAIVNQQMLKLLEALPQDGGPVLDQNPTAPDEPKRTTPQEKSNWEITLLDIAKTAIYNIKNSPDSLSPEDEEKLSIDVTPENKEEMLNLLFKLAGKEKAATAPIIKPEPEPVPAPAAGTSPGSGSTPPLTPGGKDIAAAAAKTAKASKPA
jgi:hypothetical protein